MESFVEGKGLVTSRWTRRVTCEVTFVGSFLPSIKNMAPENSQHSPDSEEGTNRSQSHKRTFSTGPDQKTVDDPSVNDPSPANDVLPPNKKTKCEPQSDSPKILDAEITPDDGDDLIPLTSQGPNVFYGFSDAILELFQFGEEGGPLLAQVNDHGRVQSLRRPGR